MKEYIYDGNIFLLPDPEKKDAVCVTTNGIIRNDGKAVMGRGIAKYARDTFRGVDKRLAENIRKYGNRAFALGWHTIITAAPANCPGQFLLMSFPTKYDWKAKAYPPLIRESCRQAMELADEYRLDTVYMPCPGCSNGQLDYKRDVRPILEEELDDRFTVCVPSGIAAEMRVFG